MIIRHSLPSESYTKVDRAVFTNKGISDGAKVLYGYLCGLRNGADFKDAYIMKAMNISKTVLARRKKELKDSDLILVDQVSARRYFMYIGHSGFTAEMVKQHWITNEEDY